jgi:glycosyltransferase involved in cell wall biosynthesis
LRILIVNTYHYRRGGDSTYAFDLAALLKSHGHEVFHFAMKHRYNMDCPEDEYFVDYVDYRERSEHGGPMARFGAFLRSVYSLEARRKFAALLDKTRPDIIHMQNFRRHLTFSILGPARKLGIPVVFTAHDYDPVCPSSLFFADGEPCEVCHGKHYFKAIPRRCKQGSLAGTAAVVLESYFVKAMRYFKHIDRIITPSAFGRSKLVECGMDPDKIEVIHNFIETPGFEPAYGGGDYVVCFGRLASEKGMNVLIEAAAQAPDIKTLIAGEGPERVQLEAQRAALGADNVEFLGYVDREDLFALVQESMFVVVPSVCYENFPYNVLESFALGKAVIGSKIGGIPEIVDEGKTGLLVPPRDPAALAGAMRRLAGDPALAETLGRNARKRIESDFGAEIHYNKLFDLYNRIVKH